jgi:hypothetical protein
MRQRDHSHTSRVSAMAALRTALLRLKQKLKPTQNAPITRLNRRKAVVSLFTRHLSRLMSVIRPHPTCIRYSLFPLGLCCLQLDTFGY